MSDNQLFRNMVNRAHDKQLHLSHTKNQFLHAQQHVRKAMLTAYMIQSRQTVDMGAIDTVCRQAAAGHLTWQGVQRVRRDGKEAGTFVDTMPGYHGGEGADGSVILPFYIGAGAVPICSTKTKRFCIASAQTTRRAGVCSMVRDARMQMEDRCLTLLDTVASGGSGAVRLDSRLSRLSNSLRRTFRWKYRVSEERSVGTVGLASPYLCLQWLGNECRVYRRCHNAN